MPRNLLFISLFIIPLFSFSQYPHESDPHRGIYIDKFFKASLIGSSIFDPNFSVLSVDVNHDGIFEKEDSILRYAAQNHITYIAMFDLHRFIGKNFMVWDENLHQKVNMEAHLTRFMKKAKSQYGITQLGAIGGSENFFDDLKSFMIRYPNADFDVVNIEYEFWQDCPNEFNNYVAILDSMDSFRNEYNAAHPNNPVITEAYLAYLQACNSSFGTYNIVKTIDGCTNCAPCSTCTNPQPRKCDRILYAWFVADPGSMNIAEQNWFENSSTGDSTDFHPIIYAESNNTGGTVDWTGIWFPLSYEYNIFTAEEKYYNHWINFPNVALGTPAQNNVQPGGVHWFASTNMVGHLDSPQIFENTGPYCSSVDQQVTFKYLGPIENGISYSFWVTRNSDSVTVYPGNGGSFNGLSKIYQNSIKSIDFSDTMQFPSCVLPSGNYTAHLELHYDSARGQLYKYDNALVIDNRPRIIINGRKEFCEGDYTYLTLTSGGLVTWYRDGIAFPETAHSLKVTADGNYFAKIIGGSCSDFSDTIHVHIRPSPNITINAVCNGDGTATLKTNMLPVNLVPINSGGRGGAIYKWNNGETTEQITVTPTSTNTVYRVNVTNPYSGCQRTTQITLKSPMDPPFASSITINNQPSSSCASDGMITANIIAFGSPNSYLWSTGETTQSISGLSAGTYTVAMNAWASGCTSYDTVTIGTPATGAPNITPVIQPANCVNSHDGNIQLNITGGSSPFILHWNSFPDDTIHNPLVQDQQQLYPGYYELKITDANGCKFNFGYEVTGSNSKPVIQSVTTNAVTGCATSSNGSATLNMTAGGPYTYLWSDPFHQSTVTATGLSSGSVSIKVTDNNGCSIDTMIGIASSGLPINAELADSSLSKVSCAGASDAKLHLKISGGASPYSISQSWNLQSDVATLLNVSAGYHSFIITDDNGCTFTDSVFVSTPDSLRIFSDAHPVSCIACNNGYLTVSADGGSKPYEVSWQPLTGTLTGNTIHDLDAGNYTICVTDRNGCSACIIDSVKVKPLNVASISENNLLRAYPNPFSTETRLNFISGHDFEIILSDVSGKIIYSDHVSNFPYILHRGNICDGLYVLKIFRKRELIAVKKLVIVSE